MYMNSTCSLINLEDADALGRTALFIALDGLYEVHQSSLSRKDILEKVAFLLDRGADITARDHIGKGVLHYVLHRESCWPSDLGRIEFIQEFEHYNWARREDIMPLLRLLLARGAGPHAIQKNGCSVTEAAYKTGSGHMWYEALFDAGFDAEEVFAQLYEDVPEARCSCGQLRAQKMSFYHYDGNLHVENLPDCIHVKKLQEIGKGHDEVSSMGYCERSGSLSPGSRGDTDEMGPEDWGIEDSDEMGLEGTASPILEGAW